MAGHTGTGPGGGRGARSRVGPCATILLCRHFAAWSHCAPVKMLFMRAELRNKFLARSHASIGWASLLLLTWDTVSARQ